MGMGVIRDGKAKPLPKIPECTAAAKRETPPATERAARGFCRLLTRAFATATSLRGTRAAPTTVLKWDHTAPRPRQAASNAGRSTGPPGMHANGSNLRIVFDGGAGENYSF